MSPYTSLANAICSFDGGLSAAVAQLAPVRVRARSTAVMNQRAFVIRHTPYRRSISHTLSRVTSGGGAASLLAVAGRIAYKDASRFEAFSCPWPPSSTSYKLREIERILEELLILCMVSFA